MAGVGGLPRILVFALAFLISAAVVIRRDSNGLCWIGFIFEGFCPGAGFPLDHRIGILLMYPGCFCPTDG